ncbi:MAG: pseudaminic acid biosynthesis-associated methylase [Sulfurimonas sp.]|jgi:pseudaminic acid biosynthesis-associated methylase|uniref:pseudaminic acid biosynthesis-associated methylase n=1 Tax=Sulfurimonas sp. TaxID=2022749 RepID=UPI0039E484D3
MKQFETEQENFWSGDFGTDYIQRNQGNTLIASNIMMLSKTIQKTSKIKSVIEFGSNIGLNIKALEQLLPSASLSAVEINKDAALIVKSTTSANVYNTSLFDFKVDFQRDLSFTKGVLIHINPDLLPLAYDKLYNASSKYILMVEYYDPNPVQVVYRGHQKKLFKRDFPGEFMSRFPDVELIDYGFFYHKDPHADRDDSNWFLMEKKN